MRPTEKEPLKFLAKHLFFGLIITFGGVAMAAGIMGLGNDDED